MTRLPRHGPHSEPLLTLASARLWPDGHNEYAGGVLCSRLCDEALAARGGAALNCPGESGEAGTHHMALFKRRGSLRMAPDTIVYGFVRKSSQRNGDVAAIGNEPVISTRL